MPRIVRSRIIATTALAVIALGALGACSKDDATSTAGTTPPSTAAGTTAAPTTKPAGPSAATIKFDKLVQQELKNVGCYAGNVDGIMGPETDAAIIAFQKAAGLETDGELGPETDTALEKAAAKGEKVCGANSGTTTKPTTPGTTLVPTTAPCTATAINAALPAGEKVTTYICSEGYAAGGQSNGTVDGAFILQSKNGTWAAMGQNPCGSASAGIPPAILEAGCVS